MSITGTGAGTAGFDPSSSIDAEAMQLTGQLESIANADSFTLPSWLSWLDGASNVKTLGKKVVGDGKVTASEVKKLVTAAYDWGKMNGDERNALGALLNNYAAKFEPAARQALANFLKVPNPLPYEAAPTTDPIVTDPVTTDPIVTDPVTTDPIVTDPGATDPGATDPIATDPGATTPASTELLVGTGLDTDLDGISDAVEIRIGLDPTKPITENGIETSGWPVEGYVWFPFFDDKPAAAFNKFDDVFGTNGSADIAGAYFESYASGGADVTKGIWVPKNDDGRKPGYVQESDFEQTAGVDISDDKLIGDDMYALMRATAAPQAAVFALRDKSGEEVTLQSGDSIIPTYVENGEIKRAELRSDRSEPVYFVPGTDDKVSGQVSWRVAGQDGAIRGATSDKTESRKELMNLQRNIKFDFLDERGNTVQYNKGYGDSMVRSWKDGDSWKSLESVKDDAGRTTGYTLRTHDAEGQGVTATEALSLADGKTKAEAAGDDVMYRVMTSGGDLKGDGDVSQKWDMWWWGRCQNTAAIDQTGLVPPSQAVKVVSNLNEAAGDQLASSWTASGKTNLLVPNRSSDGAITGFAHQVRGAGGAVESSTDVSPDEAAAMAAAKNAQTVILAADGSVRAADVATISVEEAQTMVSHIDSGATEFKGYIGQRFYGMEDDIKLKDGSTVTGRILRVETESGESIDIQRREGFEWRDENRGVLRGEDMAREVKSAGGWRKAAWTASSMDSINAGRDDDIQSLVVIDASGNEQTVSAADVENIGREDAYEVGPTQMWEAAARIKDGKSLTIEKATGTQVWNYAVKTMATQRIDLSDVPAGVRDQNALPGAMSGTTSDENKVYFRTEVKYLENGEEKPKDYFYWVKMDNEGTITDYNYMVDDTFAAAPDFFWQSHVKDPLTDTWEGESIVPGVKNRDLQAVYNASTGALDAYATLGVLTLSQLQNSKPIAAASAE